MTGLVCVVFFPPLCFCVRFSCDCCEAKPSRDLAVDVNRQVCCAVAVVAVRAGA